MKPPPLYVIFFPIVASFAATTDYNSSTPKAPKQPNAISETATVVYDQAFKHDVTLSDLKRIVDPSDNERRDGVGRAGNETSGLDEHGTFITEKRGNVGDYLYKLFGLPDRDKANGEKHGNVTPERRNDNGKASSTMRTMIEPGDNNKDKYAHRQENRFLFNHIVALEQLGRREPAETATKMHTDDNENREPTVRTFPRFPKHKQRENEMRDPLGPIFPNEPVAHGPRIPTSGKPNRRRVLTTLQPIPEPRR